MSYSFNNPCWICKKQFECKDAEKIRKAIEHIHCDNDGTHKGAGEVLMMCCNIEQKQEA